MIDFLEGNVVTRKPTSAVIQVGGIGYQVSIPISTYEALPENGAAKVLTHQYVREDTLKLFGFATQEERELFQLLLSVSGVGPSIALTALSGCSVEQLRTMILDANVGALSKIKGIGKKTAQRIVVDLAESAKSLAASVSTTQGPASMAAGDAVLGMVALGYKQPQAEKAVTKAMDALGPEAKTEDLLRESLKHL
ncbi:MAG: Holliday junction branch migration protein RuvA [Planctomycetota bacterium]|jgi:Holliday junction DNA helicase RuvA|nr:Holliday junction branch migration protein RuvA [Planctomycetota bacterium]MDP7252369.1 Holliday junction branch migration protein RuvA [Planctomycetota bacterium]